MTTAEYVEAIYSLLAKGNKIQIGNAATNTSIANAINGDEDNTGLGNTIADIRASLIEDNITISGQSKKTLYKLTDDINKTLLEDSIGVAPNQQDSIFKILKNLILTTYNNGSDAVAGESTMLGLSKKILDKATNTDTNVSDIETILSTISAALGDINTANTALYELFQIDGYSQGIYNKIGTINDSGTILNYLNRLGDIDMQTWYLVRSTHESGHTNLYDVVDAINSARDAIVSAINNH